MNNINHQINLIYINFAPYENAGNILTYLQNTFTDIAVFTFNFHILAPNQKPSSLNIYHGRVLVDHRPLYQTPTTEGLAFALLPIRSFVIFLQILIHTWRISKLSNKIPIFFTVNAFIAWTGNILKKLGLVKNTVFWVWDYYPPQHEKFMVRFMRYLYWLFDKPASLTSSRVVFINSRLISLRKKNLILPKTANYPVVGIGTNILSATHRIAKTLKLVFFGVLKRSQGLDLVFDCAEYLVKAFPGIELHIIGGGPDESYFISRTVDSVIPVRFHGFIPDDTDVDEILSGCHIGIATYIPDLNNISFFTDPSKIKRYLSIGLPVISTDVFEFSKKIKNSNAGILIDYHKKAELVSAIKKIIRKYNLYSSNAYNLAKQYQYDKIYPEIFGPLLPIKS
jgi:glycosyltransferase involved in cell wall biosynthesis